MQTIKHENCSSAMRACKRGRQAGTRRRADARVAFRLRAEAGRADLPQAPAGAGLQWAALRRRWPQPAPLIYYSSGGQLRDFGAVTDTMGSKRNFTSFSSDYVDVLSPANSSAAGFQATRHAGPISITGLPHPVRCAAKGPGGCPMYLDDLGHTIVPGSPPTHVQLAEVYWGGHGLSMSVVAFVSTDFSHWTFASIVANASWFLQTEEGPNENAVCLLADGKTLL